jgi:hypothetical protein
MGQAHRILDAGAYMTMIEHEDAAKSVNVRRTNVPAGGKDPA